MRDICRGIFRRLKHGAASNEASVYRLGSGFGGGKTHTLIALAGAALSPELIRSGETTVPAEYAPSRPVRLATFTGENTDIVRGALIPGSEDVRAKSLIGQIAWQLGGWTAFDEFREYDESLSSPGSEDIRRLLEGEPCLILVDELVQWLDRIADSKLASSLRNTRTLFSSLVQAVESSPNSVLVITTPSPGRDAYRESTQRVIDMLDEVDSVFARISIRPSHQTSPTCRPFSGEGCSPRSMRGQGPRSRLPTHPSASAAVPLSRHHLKIGRPAVVLRQLPAASGYVARDRG